MGKSKRNRGSMIQAATANAAPLSGLSDSIIIPDARDRMLELIEREQLPGDVNAALTGALSGDMIRQQLLFQAMIDTWPRLQKALRELKLKVRNAPWTVTPWAPRGGKPSKEAESRAKMVENSVWGMRPDMVRGYKGFEGTIEEIVMGYFLGHYVGEIHWKQDWLSVGENAERQFWLSKCTKTLPPRFYGYPAWEQGEDRLMLDPEGGQRGPSNLEDFPPNRFLVAVNGGHPGHPSIAAPLRALAGYWLAAVYGRKWLMQFAQLFGIPFRWANYAAGDNASKAAVVEMLRKVGSEGWGAFPTGTTLQFVDSSKGGSSLVQRELVKLADEQCDVFILGQTLTTSQGDHGSQSLGEVHEDVLDGMVRGLCDFAGEVLTHQLATSICAVNYGDDRESPGIWAKWPEQKDLKELAERHKTLGILDGSFPAEKAWVYEQHEIPMPAAGVELFEPVKQEPPPALGPDGKPLPGLPEPGKGLPKPKDKADEEKRKKVEAADAGVTWRQFPATYGSLGIPRAEMPQIRAGDRASMVQFFRARGIDAQEDTVQADTLKPSQAEYSPEKVDAAFAYTGGSRAILVSLDGYVVDGHHQWWAAVQAGSDVRVIRIMAPISRVLMMAHRMPSTTVAASLREDLDDGADEPEVSDLIEKMGKVLEKGGLIDADAIAGLLGAAWVQGAKEEGAAA